MLVPWKQILAWTPQILDLSRELLDRARSTKPPTKLSRATDPTDQAERITALEDNERRQAELVERMATQQARLAKAVTTLHRNQWILISVVVVLIGVVVWLASRV
ncbi:MAG: hypothetical protein RL030_2091 [Pseudomonadota bacterium]